MRRPRWRRRADGPVPGLPGLCGCALLALVAAIITLGVALALQVHLG